ncbi:MAG: hypothetical protein C0483_09105 [Pirellula sp.]|nr:hypothetical protein [Pirellula sp.]
MSFFGKFFESSPQVGRVFASSTMFNVWLYNIPTPADRLTPSFFDSISINHVELREQASKIVSVTHSLDLFKKW